MSASKRIEVELISAPSILGLKPGGVEKLGESLLASGLAEYLKVQQPVVHVPDLNALYSDQWDENNCLNSKVIRDFSLRLGKAVGKSIDSGRFPLILGGDCSILIGIMAGLKARGEFGLIFLDAHADFYLPEQSPTGEVADMDLAIVTGRGPELLTNISSMMPYVKDENVIHLGQRDWEETRKYGSEDIRETTIKCFSYAEIGSMGSGGLNRELLQHLDQLNVEGYWIHLDTDVLSDEINPAVDYRLPGGLRFEQVESIIKSLLQAERIIGISVAIFNPHLDAGGSISKNIVQSLARAFAPGTNDSQ